MDRPVKDHIALLEQRIADLSHAIMQGHLTAPERNHLESELRAAATALQHYREALKIEHHLG